MTDESSSSAEEDLFATTAEYYAAHRPGYSARVFEYLDGRFTFTNSDRVLDLGCGTGEIGVPLANRVGKVVAMDPNPDMLRQVEQKANEQSERAITVQKGSDTDLPGMDGPFKMVGMGRSFHWMDQEQTLSEIWRMLIPGGGIALIGNSEWLRRGTQSWQDGIYRIVLDYLDDVPDRTGPVEYDDPWDDKIDDFGFEDIESLEIRVNRSWTPDEIIGYLFSLSFCSPKILGDQQDSFETEVRDYLADQDESTFIQKDTETVISGVKPSSE